MILGVSIGGILLYSIIVFLFQSTLQSQEYHGGVSPPEFKGGNSAMKEIIFNHLVIPDSIRGKDISGTIMVSLEISSQGKPGNVKLVRGINPVCDSEALRVAALLTDWQPALNWGKPVNCRILLPIDIRSEKTVSQKYFIVSGTVFKNSTTGEPIEGALVIIKGTNTGTITDNKGLYRIEVPGEEIELEFSAMGYDVKTEHVGKNRTLNIELNQGFYLISFNSEY